MKSCPNCQKTYPEDFSLCPHDGAELAAQATETEAQLAAGLSSRFRLVRRLGKGGMGTVFLAEQIGVGNRPVALKVLNRKLLDDSDFLMRFQNEAGSTGRIHHPNVVTIYESAQSDDGTPYIAMEFLEGESLREVIKQRGALPLPEVAEILQQAAGGLNAAHKLGIIHRDLKPDNIFLTHGDEGELIVKVVDFGIAKLRESSSHTQTGTVLGTPAYMSYEQASGMKSDELDARSDIYSLGVVVYEMLTGRTPFHSDTPVGYLRKHLMEEPPPFRVVKPGLPVPPRIESMVMKALTKDRNQRYGSVLEFAQEFAQAADAGSQLAAQPEPKREAAKTQPQTTVTPVPKKSVPATAQDTVAAKAVPETARPPQRKWLGSRWKRIGIVASVVWILGTGIYFLKATYDVYPITAQELSTNLIILAIVAFAPVLLSWGFIHLVLFLVRWVRRATTAHPSRRKWFVAGSLIFLIVATAGGRWFYTSYLQHPDFTNSNKTTLADAYYVKAFRDGAYIIEHKGHRLTAKCRECLQFPDGPDKPGQPFLTDHDCAYMVAMVGKSIGDDLMRQDRNQLVYSPWRGINTVQTADFLDIIHDELIRTGSGLGSAREQGEPPPAAAVPVGQKPNAEVQAEKLGSTSGNPTTESGAQQTEAGQQGPVADTLVPNPPAPQIERPLRGESSSTQDKVPRTARDYYNELEAANNFNHYKDTYVCFRDDDVPSFTVISRGSDVIEEMKAAGAVPDKFVLQAKDLLFVETYYKGVSNKTEVFNPVGKDGTDWDVEFNAPIRSGVPFHGRMLYSIDWTTGRYRLSVYALDRSKTIPAYQAYGKCEVIHPGK